jgi:hypothetical protein
MSTRALVCWLVAGIAMATLGCFGTEGGNPLDVDAGPGLPDGFVPCGEDGGTAAAALCDRAGEPSSECECVAGEPTALAVAPGGYGQRTSLIGPTASGGFVALHQRPCVEACPDALSWPLEVHRFTAEGEREGDAITITESAAWIEQGAAIVDGTTLVVAFADERATPASGSSDLWFAHLDLTSGAWIVAPRLALATGSPLSQVRLAHGGGGYGVAYAVGGAHEPGAFFVRLDESGAPAAGPTRVADREASPQLALAPRGEGFALARWAGDALLFVPLTADGAEAEAPVSLASASGGWQGGPVLVPRGSGYWIGFSHLGGMRAARLDASGGVEGAVIELERGTILDLLEEEGALAIAWTPLSGCLVPGAPPSEELLLVSRLGAGERLQPDIVLHRGAARIGGSLTTTASGLRAAYSTTGPGESTAWIAPACAPVAP